MKICPNCNFSNKDNAKFCAKCGSTLVNVEVDEGIYCPNCHTKVDSSTSTFTKVDPHFAQNVDQL